MERGNHVTLSRFVSKRVCVASSKAARRFQYWLRQDGTLKLIVA